MIKCKDTAGVGVAAEGGVGENVGRKNTSSLGGLVYSGEMCYQTGVYSKRSLSYLVAD